jgi:succinate dehydrogenase hydrophobic anchor subunit
MRWEVEMSTKSRTLPLNKRGLNFETFMWLFTRLSALALYLFMLIAIIGALIMGARNNMNLADVLRWAFTPNYTHVQSTNVPNLDPWATPFWKSLASLIVLTAALHGLHGVLSVLDDYFAQPWERTLFRVIITILIPILPGIGIYVIWTS